MKLAFLEFLRQSLQGEEPLHPLERKIAKRWVKERLKKIYPELRNDPDALERAYQELGIEPHEGAGKGACTVYEITLPAADRRS
jgi:hypothetical protein